MSKIPTLRILEKSQIDPDQETLEQLEEEILVDNITAEELTKLFEYKSKIDEIVLRLSPTETTELLDKIDSYAKSLAEREELRDIDLTEILLFRFIASDSLGTDLGFDKEDFNISDYDLPDEFSIERFLVAVLEDY